MLRFYAEPALNRHFHNNPEIICTASRLNLGSVEHMLAGAAAYPKLFWREGGKEKYFPICYVFAICRSQCLSEPSQHLALSRQYAVLFSVTVVQPK